MVANVGTIVQGGFNTSTRTLQRNHVDFLWISVWNTLSELHKYWVQLL